MALFHFQVCPSEDARSHFQCLIIYSVLRHLYAAPVVMSKGQGVRWIRLVTVQTLHSIRAACTCFTQRSRERWCNLPFQCWQRHCIPLRVVNKEANDSPVIFRQWKTYLKRKILPVCEILLCLKTFRLRVSKVTFFLAHLIFFNNNVNCTNPTVVFIYRCSDLL